MALQLWTLTVLGLVGTSVSLRSRKLDFFRSETELNHLVVDEVSGVVYVGAVNALYQLSADLQLEQRAATGPALDNQKCTPPIEASQCHEAVQTDNVNQLLLLDRSRNRLIECGSLFKGICALRSLSNISTLLFYEDGSGEKSFVASNDKSVATVGLVSTAGPSGEHVLFVGKGNGPHDNGIIVSTRLLDRTEGREAFEAYTDHATYKAGYLSTNTQQFVAAFEDGPYVFFVFNQQDKHPARNRTLLARMCKHDPFYYSYLEVDLRCLGPGDTRVPAFGTCLAASVARPGATGVLYTVFSTDGRGGGGPRAGLCLFPLDEVHNKMEANRDACYTGTREAGRDTFYKPFHGEIQCGGHGSGASESFPCGSEHLPYPLGSRDGLSAIAVLHRGGLNLTAVTVTTENGHTIAFLGTSDGRVLKVYLAPDGSSAEYGSVLVEINKRIKRDLVLAADRASLYAMTQDKVFRLPVQECESFSTCAHCRSSQDPYCGWCVVEGRCTRRAECPRAEESGHWLWSRSESCVAVTEAQPQNMSRRAQGEVHLTVSPLPALSEEDKLLCLFGESPPHVASMQGGAVVCNSPSSIPSTPPGQDHVAVTIQLLFKRGDVFLTSHLYPFYDCRVAMSLEENLPCISCASNRWTCQWDLRYHECREASPNPEDGIVRAHMEDDCPQFLNPSPMVIPMNHETAVTFQGKNLDTVKGSSLHVGSDLLKFEEPVSTQEQGTFSFRTPKLSHDANETLPLHLYVKSYGKNIDSRLQVTLYNCSFGRSDCSLCLAADPAYQCVWCSGQSGCVYAALCGHATSECPPPVITRIQPETGPLGGGIRITILGSDLGVRADDVKRVTVAGQNCAFEPERYSVSTRIVCTIEAAEAPFTGGVEVDISGKLGHSPPHVQFTYQQPQPLSVEPKQGPQAGGTTLTINGTHLDTGSEEDMRVTLNDIPCKVTQFGAQLQCVTGPQAVPGELSLKIYYGGSEVPSPGVTFTYRENPVLRAFEPLRSFVRCAHSGTIPSLPPSGGRSINVTGQGFSLIQKFAMVVIAEPLQSWRRRREAGPLQPVTVVGREYVFCSDSKVVFLSPAVPEEPEAYNLTALIQMDGHQALLRTEAGAFEYVADPTFENFTGGVKKQVNKLIHARGTNLNKAMTIHEAEAFVGAERCIMKTLTETDLYCEPPEVQPPPKRRQKRDTTHNLPEFIVKFGSREWVLGRVEYDTRVSDVPLSLILPLVIVPMVAVIAVSVYCYWRKSQQAEREYEKIKSQLEGLEESVRDRCKKEFTDLMIEMEDQTNDVHEAGIPVLDYKTYTDRVFFLPSKDGDKDVMITGKLDIPESRRPLVEQALNQFSNLLNSKCFLINFIHTLENQREFSARAKVYFASLLTVALHGKLEYYTDIMRTLFLELMEQYVVAKNPKLMLRRSETVVERMLSNWMSICLYQYLKDSAGEPLYKLFKAIKHQVEKGPVDAVQKKAKYTLNDTGLLGDDVEYAPLTVSVIVQDEGVDAIPVKVLNCDTISQVKEKIIDQVYRTQPCSRWPKADSVVLEWRPGSTAQILSDLDLTSQREGRWKRVNTLMHYNVRDGATLILSKVGVSQQPEDSQQDLPGERHALLEEENRVWHLVRPTDEVDEGKSKRGSMKEKERTKAITEIYLTRLLSVKGTLQQFVDNFFQSVLAPGHAVPPAVKYFFDFLDEQAEKHDIKDEDTIHIWKTNSLPLRFWVNILKNPHFIFDVHVHEVVDASLSVIAQTFMDTCTRTEHKLSRDSPSNKLLYAKEISTYKKMVEDYYKGIRQMVQVSDQDMNTHLAEISRAHTDSLNTLVALHQLYQYTQKYYDEIINALEEDPAAQKMQLAFRLQQIAAALENKVTDL
ncbi:plexin-B2 isoform X1 [Balaenoptera musculus]|uniref:Plexin-B2 n=1 Tax=Balaenoptera musculus TaxID=9771 RepID=A0A8B8YHA7_BALMU|nr:plexin-B2 isoform X1 [Balaenoptera musculus]XP_036721214.1 plexin-B2 isoform X1 [Balaenoptera musculus]XP_036721215.1 plexin-B2 isoform X1 [Balaenoptera musculus]XP_036721216.1 plexin-B2 isoform X1 [Balaenoptera musculus]XP_036721218.1 plexin-B2 isoform X1 [Balaenoptera musculus]XP_036721219.1 plexin-B2 isoform X1 [Balaenoptera musculus]XP_036721220.1 plexin-B2 isoform X1 [Balaenoptera musculus]XP_036721221.1 plexin-B2 isoform X1 [Balaenoptera musculus]XP_036721222.1 plexin-B2 isoform X1